MSFQSLSPVERAIIGRLLDDTLSAGFVLSVYDGEEYAVKVSSNLDAIKFAVGATGETTLILRDPRLLDDLGNPVRIGFIWLVHGNGHDVISDYSDRVDVQRLVDRAVAVGEAWS